MPVSGIKEFTFNDLNKMNNYTTDLSSTRKQMTNTNDLNIQGSETKDSNNKVEEYSLELETNKNEKSVGKTIQYFGNSVIEGAVSVGENVRDIVELHGTDLMGKAMMKIGYIDQEIYDEMMEETKANIAINYVKDSADIINENQDLTGNVYYEETVRGIGNGIGKTAEILGLSLAGGHIAGKLGASTGATGAATTAANSSKLAAIGTKITNIITNSETYSRLARWSIAGFSGAGEELQTAFQNGATLAEAKKASYIKGTWDSFQWMIGEGINGFNPLKNQFANSALHVGLDAIDGGAEGFVQPAIQKIYMDGTYTDIFNANGGWANVGTQALVGVILSTAGEVGQNINFKNVDNVSKIDLEKIVDENPKALIPMFKEKGFNEEYIDKMLGDLSKEEILYIAKNIPQSVDGKCKYKVSLPEETAKKMMKNDKKLYLDIKKQFEKEVDLKIGKRLEKLFDDSDDYYIGVHRTGFEASAESIYKNGLFLSGHLSSGVTSNKINSIDDLSTNISFYNKSGVLGATEFIRAIRESSYYKTIDDTGYGMIVKIPKNIKNVDDILTIVDGQKALKPEYVVGKIRTDHGEILDSSKTEFKNIISNGNSNASKANYAKNVGTIQYAKSMISDNLNRFIYKDTNMIKGLNQNIKNNGLYHFSSSENVDKILASKTIKSTGVIDSYGNRKAFMFNGVPDVGTYLSNLDKLDLKVTAARIEPTDEILNSSKLKIRNRADRAISWDGKFDFSNSNASKTYFVLKQNAEKLEYVSVPKEIYDIYNYTVEGHNIQNFINNKKNISMIKREYFASL